MQENKGLSLVSFERVPFLEEWGFLSQNAKKMIKNIRDEWH
jgi:hypothetical protein